MKENEKKLDIREEENVTLIQRGLKIILLLME